MGRSDPAIKLNCVEMPKPEPSQEFAFSNGEGDVADRANDSFSQVLGDFLGSLETNLQSLIKGTKLPRIARRENACEGRKAQQLLSFDLNRLKQFEIECRLRS